MDFPAAVFELGGSPHETFVLTDDRALQPVRCGFVRHATALAFHAATRRLIAVDFGRKCICVLETAPEIRLRNCIRTSGSDAPWSVAVDKNTNLCATYASLNAVLIWSIDGQLVHKIAVRIPRGICVDLVRREMWVVRWTSWHWTKRTCLDCASVHVKDKRRIQRRSVIRVFLCTWYYVVRASIEILASARKKFVFTLETIFAHGANRGIRRMRDLASFSGEMCRCASGTCRSRGRHVRTGP